jgi:hypothetical protein
VASTDLEPVDSGLSCDRDERIWRHQCTQASKRGGREKNGEAVAATRTPDPADSEPGSGPGPGALPGLTLRRVSQSRLSLAPAGTETEAPGPFRVRALLSLRVRVPPSLLFSLSRSESRWSRRVTGSQASNSESGLLRVTDSFRISPGAKCQCGHKPGPHFGLRVGLGLGSLARLGQAGRGRRRHGQTRGIRRP